MAQGSRTRPSTSIADVQPTASEVEEASPACESELVAGRYRVLRPLGQGGQGSTFLAHDESTDRDVAIKRFDLRTAKDWKRSELFERECAVLRSIRHPAIPRYWEHFEQDGVFYLVMERVLGESLQERRSRGEFMTESQVWNLLYEVGGILETLHSLQPPVIHRDIKPSNLIHRPDGTIAIVDFGAVRAEALGGGGSTVAGTFGYMAPEQLHGRALPQTDVYGLGASIVALMTGREPENLSHVGLRVDVASEVRASAALVSVLERMLEPDPDVRPGSVREAMGAYAPGANAETNPTPRGDDSASSGLALFAQSLPLPVVILLALAVFILSLPLWLLGSLILPAGSKLVRGDLQRAMDGFAASAQKTRRALWRATGKAIRSAMEGERRRGDAAARMKLESKLRMREERARFKLQVRAAKRKRRR